MQPQLGFPLKICGRKVTSKVISGRKGPTAWGMSEVSKTSLFNQVLHEFRATINQLTAEQLSGQSKVKNKTRDVDGVHGRENASSIY